MKRRSIQPNTIFKYKAGQRIQLTDQLTVEEPLEINLIYKKEGNHKREAISITMRTPGYDKFLALGFLYSEGIIKSADEVRKVYHIPNRLSETARENIIAVEMEDRWQPGPSAVSRNFYISSSCGVCGKGALELVEQQVLWLLSRQFPIFSSDVLRMLPEQLQAAQEGFEQTGGIHAAALFDEQGTLLQLFEDVGRHNAVDKLIGWALQEGMIPLRDKLLLLSGRAGFELIQKALMAGVGVVAAIGAPSSLAVELAEAHGQTLIGFLRKESFNVYSGEGRVLKKT